MRRPPVLPSVMIGFAVVALSVVSHRTVGVSSVLRAQERQDRSYVSSTERGQDGRLYERTTIGGLTTPPPGASRPVVTLSSRGATTGTKVLPVPAYTYVLGCGAVSGGMIAGYYDRSGFPNLYVGPTNGGVAPLDDTSWDHWSDGWGGYYSSCPLVASKNGVDGRTTNGTIEDYWVKYGFAGDDPYMTEGWTQHTWGSTIGDYMKTSQIAWGNPDGSTTTVTSGYASKVTCDTLGSTGYLQDGSVGRREFYQNRGYTVSECYNEKTSNVGGGTFTFEKYKAEIDAGHPVLINLQGHTVVGIGYNDATNEVYLHDTWDTDTHSTVWGSTSGYAGRQMLSVGIVRLAGTIVTGPIFTDDPLLIRSTAVKVVHVQELRSAIDSLRSANSLAPFVWTDLLVAKSTTVRAAHVQELRSALDDVYSAKSATLPTYTDTALTGVPIKGQHIAELRSAVLAVW